MGFLCNITFNEYYNECNHLDVTLTLATSWPDTKDEILMYVKVKSLLALGFPLFAIAWINSHCRIAENRGITLLVQESSVSHAVAACWSSPDPLVNGEYGFVSVYLSSKPTKHSQQINWYAGKVARTLSYKQTNLELNTHTQETSIATRNIARVVYWTSISFFTFGVWRREESHENAASSRVLN